MPAAAVCRCSSRPPPSWLRPGSRAPSSSPSSSTMPSAPNNSRSGASTPSNSAQDAASSGTPLLHSCHPQRGRAVGGEGGSVVLDLTSTWWWPAAGRTTARLQCGHEFHLGCDCHLKREFERDPIQGELTGVFAHAVHMNELDLLIKTRHDIWICLCILGVEYSDILIMPLGQPTKDILKEPITTFQWHELFPHGLFHGYPDMVCNFLNNSWWYLWHMSSSW